MFVSHWTPSVQASKAMRPVDESQMMGLKLSSGAVVCSAQLLVKFVVVSAARPVPWQY